MCVDWWAGFWVTGALVDAETGEPLGGVRLETRLRREGDTYSVAAFAPGSDVGALLSGDDGSFEAFHVLDAGGRCRWESLWEVVAMPTLDLPRPDEIEITVFRGDCQQVMLIPVNESTVVDMSFPADEIQLRNPIPVPPCE